MKICVLSNALSVHTQRWAAAYAGRGHDVHVLSIRAVDIPGVEVHTVRAGPINSRSPFWTFLSYVRLMLTARRRLRELAPDVLHAGYVVTHGVIAAFSGFHPRVVSAWGSDVIRNGTARMPWALRRLNRFALKRADLICSTSRFMVGAVAEFAPPAARIEQVPFGVDCKRFAPAPAGEPREADGAFRVGFVKTLAAKYGPEELVRAMRQVVDAVPRARLIVAGRGPLEQRLRHLARELDLETHIEFAGFVPHDGVPRLMRTLDVFVNSSTCPESFGVVVLEASACGVPVVATRVGGVPEVCRDGETGIMVPPGDRDALAQAIIDLANDRGLREALGHEGRRFVIERYRWDDNVSLMLRHLERMGEDPDRSSSP